jgi:hypothetical protein
VILRAADGDLEPERLRAATGVDPLRFDDGWISVDGSRVEVSAVQRLLDSALPGQAARIFASVENHPLVAHLVATAEVASPQEAHRRCMGVLAGFATAITPRRYALFADAPEQPHRTDEWGVPVAEGTGREPAEVPTPVH